MRRLLSLACLCCILAANARADNPPANPQIAELRAKFLRMNDRPKVPADPQPLIGEGPKLPDGLRSERLSLATQTKADGTVERMPVWIVQKADSGSGKRPAMIVLHGTGGNKHMVDWATLFAEKGFVFVAIDARYHGERVPQSKGSDAYQQAMIRAWQSPKDQPHEHPWFYDTVWDLRCLVDYLRTRSDIDADRIGMFGISMGGVQCWIASSTDERIAVAIPAISVQSMKWSLANEQYRGRANTIKPVHEWVAKELGQPGVNAAVCEAVWTKLVPGLADEFDCPNMLRLIAPRPLLIVGGGKDPNCPFEGTKIATAAADRAYREAGQPQKLRVLIDPNLAHTISKEQRTAILEWSVRWLKP